MVESFTDKRPTHCHNIHVLRRFRSVSVLAWNWIRQQVIQISAIPFSSFMRFSDSLMFSFHAKPKKLPESSYQLRGVRWVFSPSYRNNQLNSLSSKVGDCVKNQLDGLIESSLCDSFSLQSRRESRYNRKFPLSNLPKMRKTKVIPRRSDQLFKLLSLSIYF